ncbi:hypothetical protein [Dactylosporangium sp. NPDC051484]
MRTRRRPAAEAMAFLATAAVLGILAVSGRYTAAGATALMRMLAR